MLPRADPYFSYKKVLYGMPWSLEPDPLVQQDLPS